MACWFHCLKTLLVLFDRSNNFHAIDARMDGSVLKEKSSFRLLRPLSLLNWIGALTLSLLLKLPPRKLETRFVLWSFFLLRLPFISLNQPYRLTWNTAVMSRQVLLTANLDMLDKLQKQICRTGSEIVNLSWAFGSMLKCSQFKSFHRYYFGRVSSELAELVPLPYSRGRSNLGCIFFCHHS